MEKELVQQHSNRIRYVLVVFLSIVVLGLAYLSSRINELAWMVTGIGLVVGIVPPLIASTITIRKEKVHLGWLKSILDFLKKRGFVIYLTIIGLIMIGNILMILGIFSVPPSVTITYPAEGNNVPQNITAQGTASHIPAGKELWLLVRAPGINGFFPQANDATNPSPITVDPATGTWSVTATLGTSVDSGKTFVLFPALVDQNSKAENAILNYFKHSGPVYVGIQLLPGIQLMRQVSVVRI